MRWLNLDFDRAHRVSKPTDGQGNQVGERQMIVKFSTFRARTMAYRNRKKAVGNRDGGGVRFYIDQTKRRFQLKKKAVEYVQNKPQVDFVFVDVNGNLCIRLTNGQFKYFNSEEELVNLLS